MGVVPRRNNMIAIGIEKAKCFDDYLPLGLKFLDVRFKIEIIL